MSEQKNITPEDKEEVYSLVRLLTSNRAFVEKVQAERQPNESIKKTFERVTMEIEEKVNIVPYSSYASFRVIKHRVQKAQGLGRQLDLFKNKNLKQ